MESPSIERKFTTICSGSDALSTFTLINKVENIGKFALDLS